MHSQSFSIFYREAMLALVGLGGCVEPYVPAVLNAPTSFLVVDGFINGNGRTRISLSRTTNIAATTAPPIEKGAKLFLVDNTGSRYALSERVPGFYQSDSLLLPAGRQYQLRITTTSNAAYASDLVPLKATPVIDKLVWQLNEDKVAVNLNTHDDSQQARFYRWSLVETWQFNAAYQSTLEYFPTPRPNYKRVDNRVTPIYTCWRTERRSTIKQSSTAQLSQDALTDFTLVDISTRAERLKIRYSVLVNQYAETAEEFAYYDQLRKNTEAVGTVNDPLPSQLTGNVHRVDNASEPVIGFIGAHTVQQRRLFIDHTELPARDASQYDSPYAACTISTQYFCLGGVCNKELVYDFLSSPNNVPVDNVKDPDFGDGISSSSADCVDCRRRGSINKPSFW